MKKLRKLRNLFASNQPAAWPKLYGQQQSIPVGLRPAHQPRYYTLYMSSTELRWQTTSSISDDTIRLGESLGTKLRGGEVIELVSDVGGGKTTFVRGLVHGAGSLDQVTSPSFTISNQYTARDKTIYHLDFYRLQDPGIIANELTEFLADKTAVVLIEWADIVEDILPVERLQIRLQTKTENSRHITFMYPEKLQYLIPREA